MCDVSHSSAFEHCEIIYLHFDLNGSVDISEYDMKPVYPQYFALKLVSEVKSCLTDGAPPPPVQNTRRAAAGKIMSA